jgi:response regulator RpfG family c-di-GMP phosphodiesterase
MTKNDPKRSPRILFVDDSDLERKLYEGYLQGFDCQLKTAASAGEGLDIAREFLPDIIISDVIMPGEDGLEFCRKTKGDNALSDTIFILISGASHGEGSLEGFEAGADDFLYKPFGKKELLAKLKAFLRIKFLQDDLSRTNRKLGKALEVLEDTKTELEEKNTALLEEKEMIESSLKQISLMAAEREKTNLELERLNEVHSKNIEGLITILSSFIESKRQYHRGHSKKVAEISSFMARELNLPEETIRHIETAALLHELGKLSIPDDLAMKDPRDYTPEEKNFLSQHPVQGAGLLAKITGFEEVALIIRHFHECYDGTGPPDNLVGNDIPVGSRIIALANLVENLVYRQADMETKRAFEIIEENMGSKFDPTLNNLVHVYVLEHPADEAPTVREMRLLELEPGMELAGGIFTVSGTKLLPIGTILTEAAIKQVVHYNKLEPVAETVYIKR